MKVAWYYKKIGIYSRKLEKMSPGQRRSWYAQWMRRRLTRMSERVKHFEAAVGPASRPTANYTINSDEL